MAIRVVSYDTDTIPSGERYVVLNGSDPIRFDSLDELKQEIIDCCGDVEPIVLDNQARINNLESRDLVKEFLLALSLSTITTYFDNQTEVKVYYGRKEVTNVIVYKQTLESPTERAFEEITSGISLSYHEMLDQNGNITQKYVKIISETPITGKVLVL